jgi:DNA-binding NarL/FixJ family response regulator
VSGLRVALLVSEQLLRDGLAVALADAGFEPVACTASDVEGAAGAAPDLAVVDAPRTTAGTDHPCARLKDMTPAVRVIVLAEAADDDALMDAVDAGTDGFVTKEAPLADHDARHPPS